MEQTPSKSFVLLFFVFLAFTFGTMIFYDPYPWGQAKGAGEKTLTEQQLLDSLQILKPQEWVFVSSAEKREERVACVFRNDELPRAEWDKFEVSLSIEGQYISEVLISPAKQSSIASFYLKNIGRLEGTPFTARCRITSPKGFVAEGVKEFFIPFDENYAGLTGDRSEITFTASSPKIEGDKFVVDFFCSDKAETTKEVNIALYPEDNPKSLIVETIEKGEWYHKVQVKVKNPLPKNEEKLLFANCQSRTYYGNGASADLRVGLTMPDAPFDATIFSPFGTEDVAKHNLKLKTGELNVLPKPAGKFFIVPLEITPVNEKKPNYGNEILWSQNKQLQNGLLSPTSNISLKLRGREFPFLREKKPSREDLLLDLYLPYDKPLPGGTIVFTAQDHEGTVMNLILAFDGGLIFTPDDDSTDSETSSTADGSSQTPVFFADVRAGDPYEKEIYQLTQFGIIGREDPKNPSQRIFAAQEPLNRAEFAKILAQLLDPTGETTKYYFNRDQAQIFPDVPREAWFAPYVAYLKITGFIQGYPDGTFKPEKNVNYAEAAKLLSFALKEQNNSFANILQKELEKGGEWHAPYINALAISGFVPQDLLKNFTETPSDNAIRLIMIILLALQKS